MPARWHAWSLALLWCVRRVAGRLQGAAVVAHNHASSCSGLLLRVTPCPQTIILFTCPQRHPAAGARPCCRPARRHRPRSWRDLCSAHVLVSVDWVGRLANSNQLAQPPLPPCRGAAACIGEPLNSSSVPRSADNSGGRACAAARRPASDPRRRTVAAGARHPPATGPVPI